MGPLGMGGPVPDDPYSPDDPRMHMPPQFRDADPEVAKALWGLLQADRRLEVESREIALEYRRAKGEDRDKLREKLVKVINAHFEARQERRELELKQVEKEVERLRDAIKRRNEARETIVERRVRKLAGEKDELEF